VTTLDEIAAQAEAVDNEQAVDNATATVAVAEQATATATGKAKAKAEPSKRFIEAPSIEEALAAMPKADPSAVGRPASGKTATYKAEILELAAAGMKRGDIVKTLNEKHRHDEKFEALEYRDVYNYTKGPVGEGHGPIPRVVVKLPDGSEMPRNQYIRALARGGATRSAIAKALGIPYQIVHSALGKGNSKIDGEGAPLQKFGDQASEGNGLAEQSTEELVDAEGALETPAEETSEEEVFNTSTRSSRHR